MGKKDIEAVQEFLHPDIQFIDPKEKVVGKIAVLKAAKGFMSIFKSLTIRVSFGSEDQAMVVYDLEIMGFIKTLQAASLLSFEGNLISKIELFYDSGLFQ